MPLRKVPRAGLALAALAVAVAACGGEQPDAPQGGAPQQGEAPVSAAPPPASGDLRRCSELTDQAALDGPLSVDPELAEQQRVRMSLGLRADEGWVREVAALEQIPAEQLPPEIVDMYLGVGIPITIEEAESLAARQGAQADAAHEVIERYGRMHPDEWGGVWLDQRDGAMTASFAGDLEAHRAALAELIPDGSAWKVVAAERSHAELLLLLEEVVAELRGNAIPYGGVSVDVVGGVVSVDLGVVDEAALAALGRFDADAICVSGPAPSEIVPEGPQPQSGAGWRLLVDRPGGEVYVTSAAAEETEYRALWERLGLGGDPAPVDFEREIVLHFAPAVSGSCSNIRLDELVVEGGLVYPRIVLPGPQLTCTADANPYTYLLAVERSALPRSPFRVQLDADVICQGCEPGEVTEVRLD